MMKYLRQLHYACWLALSLISAGPASAALVIGADAPDFSAPAALGGQISTFHLNQALKRGPVVLYFYPAAFTQGCTVEAHLFAEAIERYQALGASVIGISSDNISTLSKFSVSACGGKFAVAADTDHKVMNAYDAVLGIGYANRISYVIAPDHTILYQYTSLAPELHVENTLKALQQWQARQAK